MNAIHEENQYDLSEHYSHDDEIILTFPSVMIVRWQQSFVSMILEIPDIHIL
jgi:hypothetical protein